MPSTSGSGRRAAQSTASPMDNDQEERDKCLTKVQARDLVEFGMIPVSAVTFSKSSLSLTYSFYFNRNSLAASQLLFPSTV